MIDAAVAAIRDGRPVVVPTDTVYGLAVSPSREEYVQRLYGLKGRAAGQPTAIVAGDLDVLAEVLPELDGRAAAVVRALLPGPFTLVLPNPSRRFPWLSGNRKDTLGVRVPVLVGAAQELLERVGTLAATSANLPGGPDPRRLEDVPLELREGAAAVVDGGELPGLPSTVLDVTGPQPVVLREGAFPAAEALARATEALAAQRRPSGEAQ